MKRIDTRRTAARKTMLAFTLVLAIYVNSERPSAEEGSPASVDQTDIPEDNTLRLTIPKMERVRDLPVYDAPATDEATLAESALHVEGTGFPWEDGANVYIAGHRLGYEGEASHLVFYDLDVLQNGDEVVLTDANGTRYTYKVFTSFVVGPTTITSPSP